MSKKSASSKPPQYGRIGFMKVVGSSPPQLKETREVQHKARASYKDAYGGSSSNVTEDYKAGQFVDKTTGQLGYKQEAKFTTTDKYVNKPQGYTTEYQTQIKFKKSVYPNKYSSGSNYNNNDRIDYY